MNKAVFLDRDGVLTKEPPHYAHRIDQLHLINNTHKAISILNKKGYKVIVITNQAGIAHGYFKEKDTAIYNNELIKRLQKKGATIDAILYCPHHPEATIKEYKKNCDCRKPNPGLVKQAAEVFNLDLPKSIFIGDKISDIKTGKNAGCKSILVLTGQGKNFLKKFSSEIETYYPSLYHAVLAI